MGARCCGSTEEEAKKDQKGSNSNFTFMTRSISLSRLGSEVNLNKQGMFADILEAVKIAEQRKQNEPVNMHEIWRSFELNSSLHSNKFKVILLELYKQGEIISDETVSLFSTNMRLLYGEGNKLFYTCQGLVALKCQGYTLDQS